MSDFQKATAGPFFFTSDAGPHFDGGTTLAVGFRPDTAAAGTSITLAETLGGSPGVHLFLKWPGVLPPPAAFETELRLLLDDPAYWNSRILWIENPTDRASDWRVTAIAVERTTAGSASTSVVERTAFVDFRNFSLCIPRGSTIQASPSGDAIVIRKAGSAGFHLSAANGAQLLRGIGAELTLPITGDLAGCLRFQLDVDAAAKDLAKLDASFRIFYKESFFPSTDADFFVGARRYPMFDENTSPAFTLFPTLDPLNHLDISRTYFSFVNPTQPASPPTALPSAFRTTFGATVNLTARNHDSRLVFDVRPVSSKAARNDPYYLTPAGEFGASVAPAAVANLLSASPEWSSSRFRLPAPRSFSRRGNRPSLPGSPLRKR